MKRSSIKPKPTAPSPPNDAVTISYRQCDFGGCTDEGAGVRYDFQDEMWFPACTFHLLHGLRSKRDNSRWKRHGDHLRQVRPTTKPKTLLKDRADELFSKFIRERDKTCQAENPGAGTNWACKGSLQCAHIVSRRYLATRWDPANSVTLCAAHHLHFTHHPLEWERFIEQRDTPTRLYELKRKALDGQVPDLEMVIEGLEGS